VGGAAEGARAGPASRILVIEDDELLRELIARELTHHGFEVQAAGTAAEGLAAFERRQPDLVLLDLMLPDAMGWDLCRRLKDGTAATIPIVLITGMDSAEGQARGLEAGADDLLPKPFRPQELLFRVRSLLRLRQLYQSQAESERLRIYNQSHQELERLKEAFVSILSHELVTPLTVLKGYVGLLRDLKGTPAAQRILEDAIDDMARSLEQLEGLIRELLDYSRLRSGTLTLRRREIDVRHLLAATCQRFKHVAQQRGVRLQLRVPRSAVPLRVDPGRLGKALGHLVENALKFTEGGGCVSVRVRDRGDAVLIRVQDNGIGIPSLELARIFDPFYQAADHMTRRVGGIGLGLATARHIVADHGGKIWARSRPGEGSVFVARLPRSYRDAREMLQDLRRALGRGQPRPGPPGGEEALSAPAPSLPVTAEEPDGGLRPRKGRRGPASSGGGAWPPG
jgi:signal transduction histidine kinase